MGRKKLFYRLLIASFIILGLSSEKANATHIYGADLFYTHVSGNTYTVTLNVYGDCAGSAFNGLRTASPRIRIQNGGSFFTNLTLLGQAPTTGTEVTPVCPGQASVCTNPSSTIPGVTKFVYSRNVVLNTTSTNWRFIFQGQMGSNQAGRSNSITNITGTSSIMNLEATLNNSTASNSSPTYTTIPTPFFCISKPASFNPGTVDANGDSLVYVLTDGLTNSGTVNYATGYSAASPVAYSTGTFSFNGTNGQLNFTPNLVQRSLVVYRVNEYRNGVLVGTSMREMTFVVLNNCNNNPPSGLISNNNTGTVNTAGTQIDACQSAGTLTFNINPTDLDTDRINVTANGLPVGATFVVTNNGTKTPTGLFTWNLSTVVPGTYTFFVTYVDEGCPLSSKQTQAYAIKVLPTPSVTFELTDSATCTKKAIFKMTPSVSPSPWRLQIFQGATQLSDFTNVTSSQTDSLSPGIYILRVTNSDTCFKDTTIEIPEPPQINISAAVTPLVCHNDTDAQVTVTGSGGKPAFTYAIGAGTFSAANTFTNLSAGFYTFKVRDQNDCQKDTLLAIQNPLAIDANIKFTQPPCNYFNSGVIEVDGLNGTTPYLYALDASAYSATNVFSGLFSGNYTVRIKDSNDCRLDTLVTLPDSIKVQANAVLTHILCNGDSTGAITLNAFGATAPYRYSIAGGALTPTNTFTNLKAVTHTFKIEDTNKCYLDTTITLTEPTKIESSSNITDVLCNGDSTGVVVITGTGGVIPYTFAVNGGTFGPSNTFPALPAGTHTISIRDSNNCVKDTTVVITQPTELKITDALVTNPKCYSALTGAVTIVGTGGVTPYQYAVGTGTFTSSSTFNTLGAGTYTFYLRDTNSCVKDTSLTLTQPTRIIPDVQVKNSTCTPLDDGQIILSATGGVPTYDYALQPGPFSNNQTYSSLAAGSYTLTVRDDNSCIMDTTILITDSIVVHATSNITDAKCFDSSSGAVAITGKDGVNPYTYSFDSAPYTGTGNFNNLKSGTYNVKVKDDLGCLLDTNVNVAQPTRIAPTFNVVDSRCHGLNAGSVTILPSGGTPSYTFSMDNFNFGTPNVYSFLYAGNYRFRVKDDNDCIFDTSITIKEPTPLNYTLTVTDILCNGDSSGAVQVNGSGGIPPYKYRFDTNPYSNNSLITGIYAGTRTITMQDTNGCTKDSIMNFSEPPVLAADLTITDPTCDGYTDGAVAIAASGGVSPYTYSMPGGTASGNSIINVLEGTYTLTVKDANNCTYDTTITFTGYPDILIDALNSDGVSCFGYEDGMLTIDASGGIQPLRYQVGNSSPISENVFRGLKAEKYTVKVTDAAGCEKDTSYTVSTPEKLVIETKATPNDCEGLDNGGQVEAVVTGGTTPYNFVWSSTPPQNDAVLRGVANGIYSVKVTDANDCIENKTDQVEYTNCCIVFVPDAFTPNGDGLNDKAKVQFKGRFSLEEYAIYNRFGQQVFTTSNIDEGWDGVWNGEPQKIATFNYYVKGICGGESVMYKGTLTLIR